MNPKPIFLSALLCFYSVILPISLPPFHPHCLHREMSATYTRSELLALGHGPIPRLLPGYYTNLGNLLLLRRMRTSRSRRKKKRKKNEKRLSNTEGELCLINARDLRTFSTSVKVSRLLAKLCSDVLAVTETWFTDAAGDYDARSICPRGYSALQKPRDLVRENKLGGGGLALFHKNSIKATVLNELPDFVSFEHLDVSVLIRSTKVRLILIYRPPEKSSAEFLREFSSLLESTSTVSSALVITGDFNLYVDVTNDTYAIQCYYSLSVSASTSVNRRTTKGIPST